MLKCIRNWVILLLLKSIFIKKLWLIKIIFIVRCALWLINWDDKDIFEQFNEIVPFLWWFDEFIKDKGEQSWYYFILTLLISIDSCLVQKLEDLISKYEMAGISIFLIVIII